ncbi:CaiB/BaiF CoA transferase family protein [Lacimicrobium alkaliphilum]|uniref:CoA transferase n=1 Tax=Lacimicrobium alkaliphilum TaxID=1526571 RepID=A0ABQ1R8N8_9ALTE|nr:CaiB/BaiF CoA-transferase family protein [Lacimicrobium alkaliphilum]GGD60133.1 CoA transferase [Lacimicrobium alkaliphilum]
MAGPLKGIKVLDLSRILAGPWATQVLADYGASVWKIERPQCGDDTRHWGPPYLKDAQGRETAESAYYLAANRGKQSVTVDITTDEGQQVIRELAARADVLVENYKVGGLKKYGLDYASLGKVNPKLIYCSITGFGQDGPDATRPGYDAMIQAMGGLMSITGEPDTLPGGGPQKAGVAVADLMTGMYGVSAILAALYEREQSGQGQHIDLALLDTQVAWLANQASNYLVSGEVPQRMGTAHPNIVPYQSLKVKDGFILLAVGNDQQFQRCCTVLGDAELAFDNRFSTNARRVQHRLSLIPRLEALLCMQPLDHWLAQLAEAGVPCGPINTLDRVFAEPQVRHRRMQFDLPHPIAGKVPMVANPVKFSRTKVEYNQAPPTLGQHTDEVLNSLKVKPAR